MDSKGKFVAGLFFVALGFSTSARAMTIHDFGKMNNDDEATYVTLLVEESSKMLKAKGQPDQADKVIAFFKETGKFGGTQQFASNLQTLDALNKRNAINPNNRATVYQIEDAMELTLKDKGIIVPASYLRTVCKDFTPSGPPRGR